MLKPTLPSIALLFFACCLSTPTYAEDDASLHQVFQAAEAGNFKEAQSMMDNVLKNHPNSAKAHFVEAELLAKQGLNKPASAELSKAEQLDPALTFAKPDALQSLKSRIAGSVSVNTQPAIVHQSTPTIAMPNNWLMPVLLFVGLGVLILFIMALFRRNTQSLPSNNYAGHAPNPSYGPAGNPGMGSAGMGSNMGQPAAGGMGSGLMGSLATGAALGAGVVAGEALMHHFVDGDHNNPAPQNSQPEHSPWSSPDNSASNASSSNDYDMGGNDFGVQDSSSWDDDSSSGSDDDSW